MTEEARIKRWRLILGQESEDRFSQMGGGLALSPDELAMDSALAAIYGGDGDLGSGGRGAGRGPSSPKLAKWLGDLRRLFDQEIVAVVQNDAVERRGLKQLLLEPELLENLEPDLNLASTLLALKDQIPKHSKESARAFIAKIVADINKLLDSDIRRAVTAALNKRAHSPLPSAAAIDYKWTISRNLKHYSPQLKAIVPERVYFYDRSSRTNRWHVILDIDQSGSMGESIIYSSIMACILASMSAVRTNVVAFDTQIMDLTQLCQDPVDLLFGFQMGGGTDIAKSIAYCQEFVETPSKTLFFLISDLEEGGNRAGLLRRLEELKDAGVTVITLLAIADGGRPCYDETTAQRIAAMGIPCFACTPEKLPLLLERALKGQELMSLAKEFQRKK
ncbi:VWA domain-containing protein [Pseudoflavonifractor sp. 524-17]|uniref:VWA domain-containing protein n=1 Tax=Pseudoflavonifractor sp. 524-17 TaxID=2304577 RepID=UPI00137ADA3F|nr:VWA domain-containing protein [Pseudoflavonifractor sp. 524-17]NCE64777.1 VWA domain-containing protein [Pseudoflavonifractor sp. 524-17]